jgi:hypothetical protein
MRELPSQDEMPNLWRDDYAERLELFGRGFTICQFSDRRGFPAGPISEPDLKSVCDALERELSRLPGQRAGEADEAPRPPSGEILVLPQIRAGVFGFRERRSGDES